MNWDQIEGNWKQLQGRAKQQWGNLTDDDLTQIDGKREVLIGKLQQRYGIVREQAMKKTDEWVKTLDKQQSATMQQEPIRPPRDSGFDAKRRESSTASHSRRAAISYHALNRSLGQHFAQAPRDNFLFAWF